MLRLRRLHPWPHRQPLHRHPKRVAVVRPAETAAMATPVDAAMDVMRTATALDVTVSAKATVTAALPPKAVAAVANAPQKAAHRAMVTAAPKAVKDATPVRDARAATAVKVAEVAATQSCAARLHRRTESKWPVPSRCLVAPAMQQMQRPPSSLAASAVRAGNVGTGGNAPSVVTVHPALQTTRTQPQKPLHKR